LTADGLTAVYLGAIFLVEGHNICYCWSLVLLNLYVSM
jgi:hypothetical protein